MELRAEQEAALKEALREVERERARERLGAGAGGTDIQYLKNVVLKLYETGEAAALLPVVGMMLRFSPAELRRCQDALAASEAAAPGEPAPPGGGGSGAGLARRDSGSSFRSSRLGPPDDMVPGCRRGAGEGLGFGVGFGVCFRLPWPCRAAPGRHAPGLRLRVAARARGPRRPSCRVGPLLRRVGVLPPARLCWPDTSACRRPCLCRGPQP